VEGFAFNYGASFSKQVDTLNNRSFYIAAKVRYGFSNNKFNASISGSIPVNSVTLGFNVGSDIIDLNYTQPISPFVNSLYSLFERQNFEKLYQKQFLSVSLHKRIVSGWQVNAVVEWSDRKWLPNSSNFSFFSPDGREYTSNNPFTPTQDIPLFPQNQAFTVTLRTTYDFSNKYESYPYGKRYLPSAYPTIGLSYNKGIRNIFSSDVDYDRLSADISKSNIPTGVLGNFSFYIAAGKFLNNNSLFYPDYKQFAGNQVLFYKQGLSSFLLLNYYDFSTYTQYIEGHVEQNFSGFILNKVPLIRKLKLQEILDINYLSTPAIKNYTELGIGVQYLNFRLMYGKSFNSGNQTNSVMRISLNFGGR
jgi:hypothetical protein